MIYPIARGRISHPVTTEISDLFQALLPSASNNDAVDKYEDEVSKYLGSSTPILYPFARTALIAILDVLKLEPGSRILMPSITIKPLLDVVKQFDLIPTVVDVDLTTGCWDLKSLENALEEQPRLALITYLFGVVPNLNKILPLLEDSQVVLIEDFSQAFGSNFKGTPLGSLGDFGICSTSSTKTLDTYGGALVFAKNENHRKELRTWKSRLSKAKKGTLIKKILKNIIRNIATNKFVFSIFTFPLIAIMNARSSTQVGKFTGGRSLVPILNFPAIWFEEPHSFQARIGLREIKLQFRKDSRKIQIAERYSKELETLGPRGSKESISVYWQYISVQSDAIGFRRHLNSRLVDCATTSLVNLSTLTHYNLNSDLPQTKLLYDNGVYLPCYHQLTDTEQSRVIKAVKQYHER
jgi:perosamine synthetase